MNILRLKSEIAALNVLLALKKLECLCLKANFNPDQPRDPAGSSTGGQWTDGGGGGGVARSSGGRSQSRRTAEASEDRSQVAASQSKEPTRSADGQTETLRDRSGEAPWREVTTTFDGLSGIAEQAIKNRDGSTIHSEFSFSDSQRAFDEAHTVTTSTGEAIRFEQSGDTFRAYKGASLISSSRWTPDGPEPLAEPVAAPLLAYEAGALLIPPAIILYNWLITRPKSTHDTDGSVPLLAFRAREYQGSKFVDLSYVGERSKEEVEQACPRYPEVPDRTAAAVMAVRGEERLQGYHFSQKEFGTRVHRHLQKQIEALDDPSFTAETTFSPINPMPRHGEKDSIRTDVFEELPNGTICVYDVKTGKRGFEPARMRRMADIIRKKYGTTRPFILIEVRPPTS